MIAREALFAKALDVGRRFARRFFEKRGNHSEAHLKEHEVVTICTVVYELGYEAGYGAAKREFGLR